MTSAADLYIGSVARLTAPFGLQPADLGDFHPLTPDALPADYRTLLAHTGHMTVTLEAFHDSLVDVDVVRETSDEAFYAREIVLTRRTDGVPVQYGVMRIWHAELPDAVRDEIQARETPLGRVLIRHGLLRDVELLTLWRLDPSESVRQRLRAEPRETVYGRSAQILVDERPTVQLLEVVRV